MVYTNQYMIYKTILFQALIMHIILPQYLRLFFFWITNPFRKKVFREIIVQVIFSQQPPSQLTCNFIYFISRHHR